MRSMRAARNFDHERKNDHERKKIPLTILSSDHRKKASILSKIQFSIDQKSKTHIFP